MPLEHLTQPSKRTNRLAVRVRIIYFAISAFIVIIILGMGTITSRNIAAESSQRLARQYSIEAASNFQTATSPHFVLMQQIARSTTISRWLANEDDPAKKALAFAEIMGYVIFLPDAYIMFTVYETLRAYNFSVDLSLEEFYSRAYLEYSYENQWFFDTSDAELPFILNVQRNWPDEDGDWKLHLWSNHRMYYQGRFAGVFTVGFPFDSIFHAAFDGFDKATRRGYIIDQNGAVRIDSAMVLTVHDEGLPTFPALPEVADNPALRDYINQHLQRMANGIFQPGQHTIEAISLRGAYNYASIAPIIGTNWSVVVLSNHLGIFGGARYNPVIFGAVVAMIFSVVIGNVLIRRIALDPLFKLTQSVAASASITAKADIFGLERNDEIGDLSRTVQFMRDSLGSTQEMLKHREKLLNTGNQIAEIMFIVGEDDFTFRSALLQSIEMIGRCLDADRVQLWRTDIGAEGININLGDQWLSEFGRRNLQVDVVQRIPVSTLPKWEILFSHKKYFNGLVTELPPEERQFLDPQNMLKSIAIIPVFLQEQFWGFLTIEDCVRERTLSGEEMDIMHSACLMIASTYHRVEMAAKEREANNLNQILIEVAPYVIGLWDDKGNLKVGSPQAMELFGVSDPQMIVNNLFAYSPEFQPCGTPSTIKAAMHSEKAYNEGQARFEWMHKRTDGELVPTECFYKTYKYKGKTLLLSYTSDLRPIKAAEAKQREANEMVNMLMDASPMFLEVWDDNHNLIDCNNRVMNLFGLPNKEEFIEKHEKFSPEYQPCGTLSKEKHALLYRQALQESYAKSEWMHLTADGEELPVEVIYVRLPRQNRHIIVVYNHDLREVKKAMAEIQRIEIAEENSKAKSRFLAKMSHEIRTPITAVLGISEIQLHNTTLPLEIEESFAKIYSSANTLLSIVNDILDLSKVEAGKMEIINDKYEVASLLGDVVQLNLAYLGSKPLTFNIEVDENIPVALIGDELRIKQTLNNMLSNAFKYTDEGTVSLKVSMKEGNQSDFLDLLVVIQDTGRGMSEEQLKALFDEYSRFHEKEHRFETGTGLGMSITYALLKMMDATIDVDSEVGKGTTVTLVMPQKIGAQERLGAETVRNLKNFNTDAMSVAKRLSFAPESMPYGRILVVDDVEANIYVATGLMRLYDLQIDTCTSGLAAIEKIGSGEVYDIIFMDQMMPEMNGMEATAIIRKMYYIHPIVALTADALVGQAEKFLQNGFDGFLSKPIQTVHLNALLQKFVRDRHPEAAALLEKETAEVTANGQAVNNAANAKHQNIDDYFGNFMEASGINDKIRRDILRNRKNVMNEVAEAIAAEDLKTAHRLVHTLKGLVGSIGEKRLFDLAEKTEAAFRKGEVPTELLDPLGLEMERALARIRAHLNEPEEDQAEAVLDNDMAKKVFDKLARLLEANSFDALELCDELAKIPQTKELITQIETVDFSQALKTLADLRENLKV